MRHGFGRHGDGRHAGRKIAALLAMAKGCAERGEEAGRFGAGFGEGFGAAFGADGVFGPDGPFGRGGPFGGGGGPRGPRGRGRRGMFDREELRLLLLRLIADEPRHGYDLIKLLEERSGGHYSPSPGVIYPALALLADEGLIAEQPGDDQRRRFKLTADGEQMLADEAEMVAVIMGRLDEFAARAKRERAPQIERAAMNLAVAVRQRIAQGGDNLALDIAEILDEAARKIERL